MAYEVILSNGDRAEATNLRSAAVAARTIARDLTDTGVPYHSIRATLLVDGIALVSGVPPHQVLDRARAALTHDERTAARG